jgi:hypothetical protein
VVGAAEEDVAEGLGDRGCLMDEVLYDLTALHGTNCTAARPWSDERVTCSAAVVVAVGKIGLCAFGHRGLDWLADQKPPGRKQ